MAERLVVLSDMWGVKKGQWITSYLGYLQQYFDIVFYDCQQLANVSLTVNSKENLHSEFVNGGIDTAVAHLLKKEQTVKSHYLAFSTGGTIAWKAALQGLPVKSLQIVSATRLRYETACPDCEIDLIYGGSDPFRPSDTWFSELQITPEIVENFGHELYTDEKIINKVCKTLLDKVTKKQEQL